MNCKVRCNFCRLRACGTSKTVKRNPVSKIMHNLLNGFGHLKKLLLLILKQVFANTREQNEPFPQYPVLMTLLLWLLSPGVRFAPSITPPLLTQTRGRFTKRSRAGALVR